ncbi:MAG: hypothetical protein LIO46_02270 [Clostridiales bacterium]|nr:hypothetical protein [Clostridiales bacterium]
MGANDEASQPQTGAFHAALDRHPDDLEMISLYTGGVPKAAERKEVTRREDIRHILDTLSRLEIHPDAEETARRMGGIGLYVQFHNRDGTADTLYLGHNVLKYRGETVGLFENSVDHTLYDRMEYAAVLVGQEGLSRRLNAAEKAHAHVGAG